MTTTALHIEQWKNALSMFQKYNGIWGVLGPVTAAYIAKGLAGEALYEAVYSDLVGTLTYVDSQIANATGATGSGVTTGAVRAVTDRTKTA